MKLPFELERNIPALAEKAKAGIPFVYYFLFFIAFQKLEGLNQLIAEKSTSFSPSWPIFWATLVTPQNAIAIIIVGFVILSLLAAIFYQHKIARLAGFLGIFMYHALENSSGFINHQYDLWLWVIFLLIWLPTFDKEKLSSDEVSKKFLLVIWSVQAFILLTYSLSGIGKVATALFQWQNGEIHAFSLEAAAVHIASLLTAMRESTLLGPLIIQYPILGWPGFLFAIYLELFALVVAFRPSLQKVWGISLIVFHISTYLTMRAVFITPAPLIFIFLIASPLGSSAKTLKSVLSELPIVKAFLEKRIVI